MIRLVKFKQPDFFKWSFQIKFWKFHFELELEN